MVGQRIREARKAAGYTSAEKFAYEHQLDRTQYSRCERGHNMTLSTLFRIAEILKVDPSELLKGLPTVSN